MMHFPLFQISSYFRKTQFFQFYLFNKSFPIFIHQNFWWPSFSHRLQIRCFPLFSLFQYVPLFFPYLQIPPWFRKIYVFFTYFMCFSLPPSLSMMHLFTHHTMHVLDAPEDSLGAIHLWRPHGGGGGSSPMWKSTQKIKIRVQWRHIVFFSCKEVGIFFTRILSLDRKKWKFFCDIN